MVLVDKVGVAPLNIQTQGFRGIRFLMLPAKWQLHADLGTGGLQTTLPIIGADDTLEVVDPGNDASVNAVNIGILRQKSVRAFNSR